MSQNLLSSAGVIGTEYVNMVSDYIEAELIEDILTINTILARGDFLLSVYLCKQFGLKLGPTECRSWSGSKLLLW